MIFIVDAVPPEHSPRTRDDGRQDVRDIQRCGFGRGMKPQTSVNRAGVHAVEHEMLRSGFSKGHSKPQIVH